MNTYIALTIGPIYKTFQNVRRTRELWAASFFFSFIMKNINEELRRQGIKNNDFILPFLKEGQSAELFKLKGFGFFPDRIIYKTEEGGIKLLIKAIDSSFNKLSGIIAPIISKKEEDILTFLKNYFQLSYIEKTLTESDSPNPILALSPYLDSLEQQNRYNLVEPQNNYLFEFFQKVNKRDDKNQNSFLDKFYEITDINGNRRVESLIEISTRELKYKNIDYKKLVNNNLWDNKGNKNDFLDQASDTNFLLALIGDCKNEYPEDDKNPFRSYHKYYCILKADGDKIGTTLKMLKQDSDVQGFSDNLTQWALGTYTAVRDFDGIPIYIGGDDLLCIVPVNNGKENVYDLIKRVDKIFKDLFKDQYPTLSFGVSITYYKYPLSEALITADDLLKRAKKEGGDRIAVQIVKHSGNEMVSVFDKSSDIYQETLPLFLNLLDDRNASNSSITYKIRENEKVFKEIGLFPPRVDNFINHLSNSKDNRDKTAFEELENDDKFIRLVKDTINHVYQQKAQEIIDQNMEKISVESMKEIYSIIRIVKFIKGLEDDKS